MDKSTRRIIVSTWQLDTRDSTSRNMDVTYSICPRAVSNIVGLAGCVMKLSKGDNCGDTAAREGAGAQGCCIGLHAEGSDE